MEFSIFFYFRPNIYLDIRSSKQHHEIELKWLLDYLCIMTTSSEKIIVYSRYAMTLKHDGHGDLIYLSTDLLQLQLL